jgi:hypothetical protein
MEENFMRQEKCPYCGGSEIVENITISAASAGKTGLCYKGAMSFHLTEPILADLCNGCGSITRLHVQNTDRKWVTA